VEAQHRCGLACAIARSTYDSQIRDGVRSASRKGHDVVAAQIIKSATDRATRMSTDHRLRLDAPSVAVASLLGHPSPSI
jgi:hypothetical protein